MLQMTHLQQKQNKIQDHKLIEYAIRLAYLLNLSNRPTGH